MKTIRFQQSTGSELLDQLQRYFGGNINKNKLIFDNNKVNGEVTFYKVFDGMELLTFDINHNSDIEFIIESIENQDDKQMIIRFEYSSSLISDIVEKKNIETNGMYIHSANIPFVLKSKPSDSTKWLSIRLTKSYVEKYLEETEKILSQTFSTEKTWVIYDIIPVEIQLLLHSIFTIPDSVSIPLRKGVIFGKSIEALGVLFDRVLSREVPNENDGIGLHSDDYKVMISIKDYLLENLHKQISLEEICEKFYVSNSKLRRDFKKVFGTGVKQFVINTKLEQAKYTLIN
ncbi:AraC family transcriptional regulator [Flammeovirga sp. EKP202]|uniref:helix-turn-helix domain-containing protein n=1 Tax=Flammeovirga sp. EKP202 TaxID=2770592 RepID=UPI00165EE66D|nr:AraC family transcriptional regulator [Flammeovirga sp. EKP202]MBD0402827.1 helix-turn-helix transcriptional regulator [Flammeovirga sp. EKP202]